MPSGKTHDQVTWWLTPLTGVLGWMLFYRLDLALMLMLSFLFAGLMFSGDLDVKSVQYKRWGFLRWIWLPYQKWVPHRSPLSHGPVLGTLTRLVYFSVCLILFALLLDAVLNRLGQGQLLSQSQSAGQQLLKWIYLQPEAIGVMLAGLWLGALSHTWTDELVSAWKRWWRKRAKPRSKRNRAIKK
ncbi:MAG: metal-binding protein [Candidatus Sericytochromatia bacterium]|nr:metal-binding protein [Candidatus Sericytochromatia bacterium]